MIRRCSNIASVLLLLAFAVSSALWISSYWRDIGIFIEPPPHSTTFFCLESDRGAFVLTLGNGTDDPRAQGEGWDINFNAARGDGHPDVFHPRRLDRLWPHYHSFFRPWRGAAFVPHWVLLIAAVVMLLAARKLRRRSPNGCCRSCGYDLRASNNRCPECGKPINRPIGNYDEAH